MGWGRKVIIISIAIVGIVAIVLSRELFSNVGATTAVWVQNGFTVLGSANVRAPWYPSMPCAGREEFIVIAGIGSNEKGCVYGHAEELQVARFVSLQWQAKFAIRYPYQEQFHEVRGLCVGMALCAYSPAKDTLISQYSLSGYRYGAAVHTDFSSHLTKHFDPGLLAEYYTYIPVAEPTVIALGYTKPAVGAIAFSDNGMWAVLEVHEYGLIRLNVSTLEIRRISWPGYTYGHGYDPLFEVAISNDGRFIAAAGYRVGLNMYEVTPECGLSPPTDAYDGVNMGPEYLCPVVSPDLIATFGELASTHMPRFNSDGTRLTITTRMANNTTRQVVVGAGDTQQLVPYIALGDSFTSGEGETEDVFYKTRTNTGVHKCHTSTRSYPYLLAIEWGVASESVACSGARTLDIVGTGEYFGQNDRLLNISPALLVDERDDALAEYTPGVVRQVDIVSRYTPQFVSLSIGGNDVGMIDKLKACLSLTTCDWARDPSKRLAAGKEIQRLYGTLRSTVASLKQASPSTALLLVGYPRVINETPNAVCDVPTGMMFDATERRFMDETILLLNSVVRQVAMAEGVYFGNIEDSLMGHRLCESSQTPAMNSIRLGDDFGPGGILAAVSVIGAESFHPTPFGHELIARALQPQTWWPMSVIACEYCQDTQVDALPGYWGEEDAEETGVQVAAEIIPNIVYEPGDVPLLHLPIDTISEASRVVISSGEDTIINVALSTTNPSITIPSVPSGFYVLTIYTQDSQSNAIEFYQTITIRDVLAVVEGMHEDDLPQKDVVNGVPAVRAVAQLDAPSLRQAASTTEMPLSSNSAVIGLQNEKPLPNFAAVAAQKATQQNEFYPTVYLYVIVAVVSGVLLVSIWWIISKMVGG